MVGDGRGFGNLNGGDTKKAVPGNRFGKGREEALDSDGKFETLRGDPEGRISNVGLNFLALFKG